MLATDIIQKIPSNNSELDNLIYHLVNRMIGQIRQNFANLNSITKQEQQSLFDICNITPEDFVDIIKEYPGGGQIMGTPLYSLITLIMIKYLMVPNERNAEFASLLLSLIMLARLKYRYIRIMDPEIIDMAFSMMNKKTYIGTNGIVWAIHKISNDTMNKYAKLLKDNPNNVQARYRYIIDIRNKFNQFMKHIARMYYYVIENKDSLYTDDKIQDEIEKIIDYINTNDIHENILEIISNSSIEKNIDKVSDFKYEISTNYELQNEIKSILFVIKKMLIKFKKISNEQQINIDFTSIDFLKKFITRCKKSSVISSLASKNIFSDKGYDPYLVISFCATMIILWESISGVKQNNEIPENNNQEEYNNDEDYDLAVSEESVNIYSQFEEYVTQLYSYIYN